MRRDSDTSNRLLTLYATGMRRDELVHLKVGDTDSARMLIHIRQGKAERTETSCSARGGQC
jgi:site-specific recombinase XerD